MTTSMEQIGNMISHDKGRNISMFAGGNAFISAIERFRKDLLVAVQEGQEDLDTTRYEALPSKLITHFSFQACIPRRIHVPLACS